MESNPNIGMVMLFWCVFGIFVYRSKRRGKTVLYFLGTFFGTALLVGFLLVFLAHKDSEVSSEVGVFVGQIVAMAAGIEHSRRTRIEAAAAPAP
jgi:succinate-acetate transporter protein